MGKKRRGREEGDEKIERRDRGGRWTNRREGDGKKEGIVRGGR